MKSIIKRSFAFIVAFIVFVLPLPVSALSSEPFVPDGGAININMSDDAFLTYKVRLENFMSSYSLDVDDYYYFYANAGSSYTWIFPKDSVTITYAYDGDVSVPVLYSDTWASSTLDRPISWETNTYNSFWTCLKYQNGTYDISNIINDSGTLRLVFPSSVSPYCFISYINPPYSPDFTGPLVGFPVGLEFSVADFMQWLVDNDKIAVSVDSGGASVGGKIPAYIGMSKLRSFLEFYKQFGGSNISFVSRIWSWFSYMNIANQTNDNIVILKNTVDSLYREYINSYKHEFYSNSANQAHHRRNVNTQTTDDDLTLVTDTANDDIYTTLLREIIRGIVALQSSTVSGFRTVIDTLNNLDFSVIVANNGGEFPVVDLASLYTYDSDAFSDDLQVFEANVAEVQNIPQGYIDTINQNSLMPENMLSDKNSLTVNVPCITGFTISNNGSSYSTQTGTYTLSSSEYPWLDTVVQKIKRFASIILIIGYLVHLRYRIPELVRGE